MTLILFAATVPTLVSAAEPAVPVPEVDPHPDQGYVDVYYNSCPVTGSDPCTQHYVGRVSAPPCATPVVDEQTTADTVTITVCGTPHTVDVPCTQPTVSENAAGPDRSVTVTCGTLSETVDACVDPSWGDYSWSNGEEIWVDNCGKTIVDKMVCLDPAREGSYGSGGAYVDARNPTNCYSDEACLAAAAATGSSGSVTAGRCNAPTTVGLPCVSPVASPDLGGPDYGATVGNCATTVTESACVGPSWGDSSWSNGEEFWVDNCGKTVVDKMACTDLVHEGAYGVGVYVDLRNPSNCYADEACAEGGVVAGPAASAGRCGSPVNEGLPCTDTSGTTLTPSSGGFDYAVVVCGHTYAAGHEDVPTPYVHGTECVGYSDQGGDHDVYCVTN